MPGEWWAQGSLTMLHENALLCREMQCQDGRLVATPECHLSGTQDGGFPHIRCPAVSGHMSYVTISESWVSLSLESTGTGEQGPDCSLQSYFHGWCFSGLLPVQGTKSTG